MPHPILALLVLAVASPRTQEFKGGRLHAIREAPTPAERDEIVELDETGAIVRAVDTGTNFTLGFAFGPNGHAFVTDGTVSQPTNQCRVLEIDGQGNLVNSFLVNANDQPRSVAFGSDGRILLNFNAVVSEYSPGGAFLRDFPQEFCGQPIPGPLGHVLLPFAEFGGELGGVHEFDPSAISIRNFGDVEIVVSNDNSAEGVRRPTDGATIVLNANKFLGFDANGAKIADKSLVLTFTRPPVIGPDGVLYVGNGPTIRRVDFDGTSLASLTPESSSIKIDFAPTRFKASVTGTFIKATGAVVKIKETAIVSVHPAAGRMDLQWVDDVFSTNDVASQFGATAWVFRGHERAQTDPKLPRYFHGTQAAEPQVSVDVASLGAEVRGKVAAGGAFVPTKVLATLHRSNEAGILTARIVTSKRLN